MAQHNQRAPDNEPVTSERLRNLRLILLQAAVAIIPLTFSTSFLDAFNVPKLGLLVLVVGLSIGLLATEIAVGMSPGPPPAARALAVPVAALTVPLAVAWIAGPYQQWSLVGDYPRFQGIVPYVVVAAFGLLLAEGFRANPVRLAWAMGIAGGGVGGYLFFQMLGLDPVTWPATPDPYTASTIGNVNFAGGFLAIALPFPIYLWVDAHRGKVAGAALTILTTLGLIFTFSQGAWAAGFAAGLVTVGCAAATKWTRAKLAALLAAGAIAVALPAIVILAMAGADLGRLGPTAEVRGHLWTAAIDMAAGSPVVGRGPNTYALEGLRHVSIEKTITEPFETPDDPHSVFLSFLANAGLFGAAGFGLALGWFVREAIRLDPHDHLGVAFLAGGIAYWVQSLVSIDELVLRVGFWVCLAGLVACRKIGGTGRAVVVAHRTTPRILRAATLFAGLIIATGSVVWTGTWTAADLHARRGQAFLGSGRFADARDELRRALQLRDEVEYRQVLALGLGREAIARGPDGTDLITEMEAVNSYLDDLPWAMGIFGEAQSLHHWGHFESGADDRAFELYELGLRLDPSNLLALIESSEVLVDLGRPDEALERLQPLAARLEGRVAPYWGALAIAFTTSGDDEAALGALERGGAPNDCRGLIATELITQSTDPAPPLDDRVLLLRLVCDPGLYGFLLDHLPAEVRVHY